MKNILTLALLLIPGVVSSMSVTGYSGGGVQVTCRYDEGYRANQKYFCKLQWSECKYIIKTKEKNKWVASGRFSLYDDTESAVFTVIIRGLREGDSGKYYCGTKRVAIDRTTEVNLEVITGQQIRTVRGYSGGNVIINYKMKHKNHVIDVCKSAADPCVPVITTNRRAEQDYNRRFSVHDDRSAGLVRLFIRDLTENDSGKYKITVTVSEDYSFFSEFDLDIQKDDCCVKSISLSASAGGSVNISCKYPQSHSGDVKFLCRRSGADLCAEEASVKESRRWTDEGKIQLYDDRKQQLLMGSISHVTERDSEYWCGVQSDQGHQSFLTRVLITITETSSSPSSSAASFSSVKASPFTFSRNSTSLASLNTSGSSLIISLVLLVLIIAGLLLLFLWKKRQSQGGDSSSQTEPGKHEVVSHTGCDYEEIKDTHKQLPTTPSDSSNCVYATVETATGDSRCCITSAEDLNYAVVDFHKEPDCPDSVGFRNDQDFSEYAAVNHLTA